jgi:hypothetical protein
MKEHLANEFSPGNMRNSVDKQGHHSRFKLGGVARTVEDFQVSLGELRANAAADYKLRNEVSTGLAKLDANW